MSQSDFVSRGQALVSAGQYQEAVKVCRLGLLGRPTTVEGRVVLGQALLALKRYDEVLAEMRVALELDHSSLPASVLKGEALLRKGDPQGAIDVLQRARLQSPNDPKIARLMADAQQQLGSPTITASHPSVGYVGGAGQRLDENTRHYPSHGAEDEDTSDDPSAEQTGGSFTRPKQPAPLFGGPRDATPPPNVLAVGDRSGTLEVDPELEGVELADDDGFGDVAAPPLSGVALSGAARSGAARSGAARAQPAPSRSQPARAQPSRSQPRPARAPIAAPAGRKPKQKVDISTVELDDDEMVELDETRPPRRAAPGPGTHVRNAVQVPPGPLGPSNNANRPTAPAPAPAPPAHLAQVIASSPHALSIAPPSAPPAPLPPAPIAAALPTVAAAPVPPISPAPPLGALPPMPFVSPAANRPTMAQPVPDPYAQAQGYGAQPGYGQPQGPAWAHATVAAGHAPGPAPQPMPPPAHAMPEPMPQYPQAMENALASLETGGQDRIPKTGMRRSRSRLQIVVWIVIGGLVIGGGVFAGFQIRAMRLEKQIAEAREQAITLAQSDTWKGWLGARDRLAGIAQASATVDNLATLARTRALVAFEFGDGLPEAKAAVDALGNAGGLDGELATGYLALAQSDDKAARTAADRALAISADDPAASYILAQAALLAGDSTTAIKHAKLALEKEPRPSHAIGLARAHADAGQWKEAIAVIDKALAAAADHPGLLVERGRLLATSGQIGPNQALGAELRSHLQKVVAEGGKPPAEQPRGVSPAQVAYAQLALTLIDFLRGEITAMQADFRAALEVGYDGQAFAEQVVETLYFVGDFDKATTAAQKTLTSWPQSAGARIGLARIQLVQGKPADALATLAKLTDLKERAFALAVRGQAHLALGDLDAARADFDVALKKVPSHELALVGRTWLDLEAGDVDAAKQRIEPRYTAFPTPAVGTAYAAVLRRSPVAATRDQARTVLEKVVAGAPGVELTRAQLELARIYRDAGDDERAQKLYADARVRGSTEARLESAVLMIERDAAGGRAELDALLKATEKPSAELLLETARARTLVGEHRGGEELLNQLDKQWQSEKAPPGAQWRYDRERARLALRRGDLPGAAASLAKALESCGDDFETFLIAVDVAAADESQKKLGEKVGELAKARFAGRPELDLLTGKLLGSQGEEAGKAFEAAMKPLEAASRRRQAQVHLGRAIVAYNRQDDPAAINALDGAMVLDPTLYEAYLYYADIKKEKDPKLALAKAQLAAQYNPDSVDALRLVGILAHRTGDKKLLAETITRLGELAPSSDALKDLRQLR